MIPWLTDNTAFPNIESSLHTPNGLLAAGGELSTKRLLDAYHHGIFPWFNPGDPVLWWSPDPRMVLFPSEFKISRSLLKVLRNSAYEVRTDSAFEAVMRACAEPRGSSRGACDTANDGDGSGSDRPAALPAPENSDSPGQGGTWIDEDMIAAYCELHRLGYAHSVEVWKADRLVGGLYGVSIGRMYYGESMFSRVSNASKIALAHLARQLERWKFGMIDCQMYTPHLASLGAREISRREFIGRLQELIHCEPTEWQFDSDLFK